MTGDEVLQYTRALQAAIYFGLAFYLWRRAYRNHLGSYARRWLITLLALYFTLDAMRETWATYAYVVHLSGSGARVIDGFWYPLLAVVSTMVSLALVFVWRKTDREIGDV